jgi:hypothetical protein
MGRKTYTGTSWRDKRDEWGTFCLLLYIRLQEATKAGVEITQDYVFNLGQSLLKINPEVWWGWKEAGRVMRGFRSLTTTQVDPAMASEVGRP